MSTTDTCSTDQGTYARARNPYWQRLLTAAALSSTLNLGYDAASQVEPHPSEHRDINNMNLEFTMWLQCPDQA
jgi:hypothetical protein